MKNSKLLRKMLSLAMVLTIISTTISPALASTINPCSTLHSTNTGKKIPSTLVKKQKEAKLNALYLQAVADSRTIEPKEILPVVSISKNRNMVTWNDKGDKVLLLTWHKYPDSYVDGTIANLKWGEVWTFTDKEMKKWVAENGAPSELRLEQLLGLPIDKDYTHITALWVNPADVVRPAYTYSASESVITTYFLTLPDDEYLNWFNNNIKLSYEDSSFPWTRLGYTYDWADNGTEYGLSEFIIKKGSDVEVAYTLPTKEFFKSLTNK
ncbi:MAG: hypothetical protein VB018_05360 [Lachnospiraceae bacterium]|nr:hypothetical protein [Lachnospiraceae bacterium]